MRLTDSIRRSGRSLRHAKLRTILTMMAISIGSFALMLTLAAGEGARAFVDRLVSTNFNPKAIYVLRTNDQEENPFAQDDQPEEYKEGAGGVARGTDLLTEADLAKARNIANVERVSPSVQVAVEYVTAGQKKFVSSVLSIEEGTRYEALAGTIPEMLNPGEAIVPESFVQALGFSDPAGAIGKKITIQYRAGMEPIEARGYTVVAVAKKPNGLVGGARNILLAQQEVESVYRLQTTGGAGMTFPTMIAYVKDDSREAMDAVQNELKSYGYQTMSARELAQQVTQAVNIVQYFVAGFGLIALLVSIFGIINTQLISVLERTREIGLMKALGMSGLGVMRLFTFEAMWIGFGGAAIGIGAAYAAGYFVNPWLEKKLHLGGDLLIFVPAQMALLVLALMIIAALAGLLPAWKAARLNPIEALRTE